MFKKIVLLSAVTMLILSITITESVASPETIVYVYPEESTVKLCETFTIDVNVADVSGLQGFDFCLSYDTTILDGLEVEEGPFMAGFGLTFVAYKEIDDEYKTECGKKFGRIWFAVALIGDAFADGSGTLATITFNATAPGESALDLHSIYPYKPNEVKLCTCGPEPIPNTAVDGYVVVSSDSCDPPDPPEPPCSCFTRTPLESCIDQKVTFNASSSYDPDGYIVSYTWDFGDGNTTTLIDPVITHNYAAVGTYNVTLTVTDNDGLNHSAKNNLTIRILGDLNGDGIVNVRDVAMVARVFGTSKGEPDYNPSADLDQNGTISISDVAIVAQNFGRSS